MRKISSLILSIALSCFFAGCPEKKGSMEKAGEKIDNAAEKVGDVFDKKGPLEKAGEKADEALESAKEALE